MAKKESKIKKKLMEKKNNEEKNAFKERLMENADAANTIAKLRKVVKELILKADFRY